MIRLHPLRLLLLVLMAVVWPALASAATVVQLETRVRGIELAAHTLVGGSGTPSPEKHLGNAVAYDEIAPGYSLAAEGTIAAESQLAQAANAADNLTASNESLEHVLERHAFGSPAPNAGKFASTADIPSLIKDAVANGTIRPGNTGGRLVFEQTFSSPIGVTRSGGDAFRLRVVLKPDGSLVTAFPF